PPWGEHLVRTRQRKNLARLQVQNSDRWPSCPVGLIGVTPKCDALSIRRPRRILLIGFVVRQHLVRGSTRRRNLIGFPWMPRSARKLEKQNSLSVRRPARQYRLKWCKRQLHPFRAVQVASP